MTYAPKPLVSLFEHVRPYFDSEKFGGVVGDANHGSGYHVSPADLHRRGIAGTDYSMQCPADLRGAARLPTAASAVDLTFSRLDELVTVTRRLRKACTPGSTRGYDPRVEPLREHIGTLDGRNVCGYNRVATGSGSRSRVGWTPSGFSDSSHLWHAHLSILRDYTDDLNLIGLAEVVAGQSKGKFGWRPDPRFNAPEVNPGTIKIGGRLYPDIRAVDVSQTNRARQQKYLSRNVWYVQEWLRICGYNSAASTGVWSARTQSDYNRFRKAHGYNGADALGPVGLESLTKLRDRAQAHRGPVAITNKKVQG
jgi:hypothetical protein